METILKNGWTAEEIRFGKEQLSYLNQPRGLFKLKPAPGKERNYGKCLSCENPIFLGDKCLVLRDPKGHRRAIFCSVPCQRRHYFDKVVRKKGQKILSKKKG
jgi:hypothetical protein